MTPILAVSWTVYLLAIAFVLVCLFMMLVILIQKPKGGGLSGAFGGASGGSAQAAFGAKTGDVLTWFTVICFALFLFLAMGLQWAIRPDHERLTRELSGQQAAEEALDRATGNLPLDTPNSPDEAPTTTETADLPPAAQPAPEAANVEAPDLRDAMEAGEQNVQQLTQPTPIVPESAGPQSTDTTPAQE